MKRKSRFTMTVLVLLWAGVIFWFSSQNADQSSQMSGSIVEKLIAVFVPEYQTMAPEEQVRALDAFTFVIRKAAHFSEYLIFGGLLWGWCLVFSFSGKKMLWVSWLAGSIYAVTDEFHQMFSDGRSPQMGDVGIDSIGVLCGVLLCFAVFLIRIKQNQKQSK